MSRALATREPECRALMMYDQVPEGCIAFPCTDRHSEPHVCPGEFVLVDTRDTTPRDGEVYVIQWQSGRRCIYQATRVPSDGTWIVHSLKRLSGRAIQSYLADAQRDAARSGHVAMLPGWSDGWYDSDHLEEKLVGCVIGLYAPQFEEPKREAAQ